MRTMRFLHYDDLEMFITDKRHLLDSNLNLA